ncbi:flagellar export chaperone FlgN [Pelomonas sp. KK5]|uniref:flagellar export chaperone FlgN n=1 Tax=Pelomonas sp. KK5 TaxID=1855730 RepID=UPI00097BB8B7|nr:flagellar export chaperone FlgN [Pelomonas sp. KK5]
MSSAELLRQLLLGLQADQRSYLLLQELLDEQLAAIAQQRSQALEKLAARITALTVQLDEQRRLRVELVSRLLGPKTEPSMTTLFERLPATAARVMREAWDALELQVRQCKALNKRNGELIVEQHALMQQLLGTEEHVYAER